MRALILAFALSALVPSAAQAQTCWWWSDCSPRQESFWERQQRQDLQDRLERLEQQQRWQRLEQQWQETSPRNREGAGPYYQPCIGLYC